MSRTTTIETQVFDYEDELRNILQSIHASVRRLSKGQEDSIGLYDANGNRIRVAKLTETTLSDGSTTYDVVLKAGI